MLSDFFDRQGNEITMEEWQEKFADKDYQILRQTTLHDGTFVSTVWLGLSHGMGPDGPMIFETLVRAVDGEGEEEMYRYATEEQALRHHNELVGNVHAPTTEPSRWWQLQHEED